MVYKKIRHPVPTTCYNVCHLEMQTAQNLQWRHAVRRIVNNAHAISSVKPETTSDHPPCTTTRPPLFSFFCPRQQVSHPAKPHHTMGCSSNSQCSKARLKHYQAPFCASNPNTVKVMYRTTPRGDCRPVSTLQCMSVRSQPHCQQLIPCACRCAKISSAHPRR
jgi:hypothetical protein